MADVDLTPTAEMARNAARGLELRREHGRGGTEVGVARARDISNGKTLSPETVRRMHAFFSRHAKNKAGGEDDAGYIAWMLWGGDEGRDWASRKVDALDRKESNAMSETRKAIMERLGMAATNDRPGAKAKMAKFKVGDRVAYKPHPAHTAGELVEIRKPTSLEGVEMQYGIKQASGGIMWVPEGMVVRASRPGARAKFAVSITGRRGRQPGIPGGWLTGTWDGGKWAALVFAEGSAEYGLPEFRNISKLWIADKKGKDIVNYDRGWDVKPATPEAREAFMEIGRVASAEASKMPASRPGAKAKMARWEESHAEGWGDLSKTLTATINGTRWTIVVDASTGKGQLMRSTGRGPQVVKEGAVDQLKRYAETAKSSRPGAKAAFGKPQFRVRKLHNGYLAVDVNQGSGWERYDTTHEDSWDGLDDYERGYEKAYARGLRWSGGAWRIPSSQFSRPGAKAKMGMRDTKGRGPFTLQYIASGLYGEPTWLLIDKANKVVAKEHNEQSAKEMLRKANAGEPVYVSSRPGAKVRAALADACWEGYEAVGTKPQDGKTVPNCVPKATAAKPAEDDLEREDVKAGLKLMAASDPAVSDKIRTLIKEGKPQDQAVAIALDMKRRGEL